MPLLVSLLLAGTIAASDHKLEAKAEADRAMVFYRVGKFNEALTSFAHAYELFQAPGLLFNLGQCHRQLGHHRAAIFFYTEYLHAIPAASNREQVETVLSEERAALKLESEASRLHATPMIPLAEAPGLAAPSTLPAREPLVRKWWFWTAIGGSAAIVTAAAIVTGVVVSQAPRSANATSSFGILDRH